MFLCGVIEGFYGRSWPQQARLELLAEFPAWGLDTYVYAPKADSLLRRHWRELYDDAALGQLQTLRHRCRQHGVRFGIGLSPWGLQDRFDGTDADALQRKLAQLDRLQPDLLGILFDDMPGDFAGLAQRQAAIVAEARRGSSAERLLVCPTYYSFDPILEQLFGAMPPLYLEQLGAALPADADLFWTGARVLSTAYTRADLDAFTARAGRPPLLWDNYPVNDGRKSSRFLHLRPVTGRPAQLQLWSRGILANPMNQPMLSALALASLGACLRDGDGYDPERFWAQQAHRLVGAATAALLTRDLPLLQDRGLDDLEEMTRLRLIGEYRAIAAPAATEVVAWLEGRYAFDPACLTE